MYVRNDSAFGILGGLGRDRRGRSNQNVYFWSHDRISRLGELSFFAFGMRNLMFNAIKTYFQIILCRGLILYTDSHKNVIIKPSRILPMNAPQSYFYV